MESTTRTGEVTVEIKGLAESKSEAAARICREDLNEVITAFMQDKVAVERGLFDEELLPEELTQVRMGKIIKEKFPELDEGDQEAVREHAIAALNLTQKAKQIALEGRADGEGEEETNGGSTALIDGVRRFVMDVRDLEIDLIDRINPFGEAYAILAKAMNEESLRQVAAVITAKKVRITPDEARDLARRALRFKQERGPAAVDHRTRSLGEVHGGRRGRSGQHEGGGDRCLRGSPSRTAALLGRARLSRVKPEKVSRHTAREERIIAGFEEIQRFVDMHGRAPERGEDRDVFERLCAVRLDRILERRRYNPRRTLPNFTTCARALRSGPRKKSRPSGRAMTSRPSGPSSISFSENSTLAFAKRGPSSESRRSPLAGSSSSAVRKVLSTCCGRRGLFGRWEIENCSGSRSCTPFFEGTLHANSPVVG